MKLKNVVGAVLVVGAVAGISYAAGAASTTTMTAAPELNREQALRRALALAPLKLAIEARQWARLMGRPRPHTAFTSQLLRRALDRADSIRGHQA